MSKNKALPTKHIQKIAERQKEFCESYLANWPHAQVRINRKTLMLEYRRRKGKRLPMINLDGWRRPTLEEWEDIVKTIAEDLKKKD